MKIASFFSGAGFFDLGMIQAEHEIVYAMDCDKYCKQTYDANFPHKLNLIDFNEINPDDIPDADVYIGGPPCQDFSISGKGVGIKGERGSLINKYVDLIKIKKPKWVIIENVQGLTFKPHKDAFDGVISALVGMGYVVSWKILNSKDYGVPQSRNRVFIVAGYEEFEFPARVELTKCLADIMDDEVDEKYYLSAERMKRITLSPIYKERTKEDIGCTVTAGYGKIGNFGNYIKVGYYGENGSINQGGMAHRIYDDKGISPTCTISPRLILAGNSSDGSNTQCDRVYDDKGIAPTQCGSGKLFYNKKAIRRLTPRECARLQGVPEDFKQVVSDSQFYKQVGNGVTVSVAKALGEKLK